MRKGLLKAKCTDFFGDVGRWRHCRAQDRVALVPLEYLYNLPTADPTLPKRASDYVRVASTARRDSNSDWSESNHV